MTVIYVFWCYISWRWASHMGHAKMLNSCFNQINFPSEKNKFFMSSWNCFWLCITCISIRSCVTRIYTQTSWNQPSNKHTGPSTMYWLLSVLYSSFFAEKSVYLDTVLIIGSSKKLLCISKSLMLTTTQHEHCLHWEQFENNVMKVTSQAHILRQYFVNLCFKPYF